MKTYLRVLALALFALLLAVIDLGQSPQTGAMAAIAALMALLWITEAIPLAATALLPLVLLPLLGIAPAKEVATKYINSNVFLLIGGFLIAQAMERWQLHRRIALIVLSWFGGRPAFMVTGFMAATAFLSMWISNTAATLVMLPIALAILANFETRLNDACSHRLAIALLLAIAYSASVGGMISLVGTPPNLVFAKLYHEVSGQEVDFLRWALVTLPVGVSMLGLLAIYLYWAYLRGLPHTGDTDELIAREKARLGRISREEAQVAGVFAVTALLWIGRKGLTLEDLKIPGWQGWLPHGNLVDDGTVAIAMASLLFLLPARLPSGKGGALLDSDVFLRLPWPVVILFGGGFALAYGFEVSGLSGWIAMQLQGLAGYGRTALIVSVATAMTFLTELTSNTASTQLVLPILISLAKALTLDPVWLMLPATLSASCAFMLPVATPPNAIVFGSGRLRIWEMVKTGFLLNVLGIVIVASILQWLIPKWF